jgi:tetratricopeptide (TPR) repeat protein
METGRLAQAADMLGRAVELFKTWGSRRGTLIALINLGTVNRQLGLIAEARAIFNAASELQAEGGDRLTDCYLSVHTAIFYHEIGKTLAARAAYIQALEMMRELGERRLEGMTLGALANLYRSIGYTARAEAAYHEALALHEIMRDTRSAGIVLGNLASLYQDTSRLAEAEETYVQALDAHRDSGNLRSEAIARGNLAILYRETGRIVGANRLFEQAIVQLEQVGDKSVRAAFMAHRGALCLLCGDIDGAGADAAEVAALLGDKAPALRLENSLPLQFRLALARAVPLDFGEVEGATRERELARAKATLAEMNRLHNEIGRKASSPTAKLLATCEAVLREAEAALNEWRPPRVFRGFLPAELQPQLRQSLLGLMRDLDREHFKDFCWQNPYLHSSMAEGADETPPDWTSLPRN